MKCRSLDCKCSARSRKKEKKKGKYGYLTLVDNWRMYLRMMASMSCGACF